MPRSSRLIVLFALATAACNPFASDGARAEVCGEEDRNLLVGEKLQPEIPSEPFTVAAGDDVWVGLISDSDFSESALVSQVTGLYVIAEGEPVDYTRNDLDFVVTDAPSLDYEREGQFDPFEFAPGTYQVWSLKSPEIAVVVCGGT